MPDQLQVTLFGSPEVRLHGQPVTGFRTSKAQALLYYLAVTGRPHTRATLVGLLWGDQPEDAARASLSKCLSNLRDLLGDAVLIERQTVAFNRDYPYDLDTERFAAVGQPPTVATCQSQQATLALYRGDLLEGFYVREAPDFEQWLLVQRAHYREAVINGLHALAGFHEQVGDLPSAITHTRRLLALEPWREEAHRQLMILLAHSGQRAAALAQFETCRRVLGEELAVEPDAETVALFETIRHNAFASREAAQSTPSLSPASPVSLPPARPVTHNLPMPPTPLIGRTLELTELDQLMFDHGERLITITGPGGMGKTRLALALAEQQMATNRFRDGVWFVSLVATEDAQTIIPTLASVLKLPDSGNRPSLEVRKQQVLDFLRDKQLLLLFDNFEQVVEGRTLLVEILTAAPTVYLLVTSRERLHLRAEQVYPISGLACPATISDVTAPALTLFLRTARRTHLRFQPNAREQQDLVRICQLTAGMPLALELTAGWINLLPTTAIAEALQANLDLLATTMHDVPARHRSMHAIFDATWMLLANEEQRRFAQLSVFRGGFTLAAAQAVSQVTLQQLAFFVDKSLLDYQGATERYTLHELLRQYATEKLGEYGEQDEAHWRHLRYFLLLAETLAEQMNGPPQEKLLVNFDRDLDNFRAALTWGFATGATTASIADSVAWLVARLARFWDLRRHWQEGSAWLDKALTLTKEQGQAQASASQMPDSIVENHKIELQAVLLFQAGLFAIDLPLGQTLLEQSLAHYQSLGNQLLIAQCLYELGAIVSSQGDYIHARTLYEESLLVARRIDDHYLIANALVRLANLLAEENDVQQARALAQESLIHFRQLQDSRGMISSQISLAQCHLALGDYEEASALLEEAMALDRIINPGSKGGPWTYRVLGLVKQMQGDYAQAANYYQRSLVLRHENQLWDGMAWAIEGLVEVAAATAQPLRAAHLGGAAESLRRQVNSTISGDDLPRYQQALNSVCALLGEPRFQAAWASGSTLSVEQIVTYALADTTLQETFLA